MFYRNLREEKEEILPLTELQKEMFAAVKLNKCDYLETVKVFFSEKLDIIIAKNVLDKLVQQQQALRTVFRMAGAKEPVQILIKKIILPLYINAEAPLPNMENEPWNIVIDEQSNSMELRYCHIVMDGWGMSVFWNEFLQGYNLLANNLSMNFSRSCGLHDYHEKIKQSVLEECMNIDKKYMSVECKLSEVLHFVDNGLNSPEYKTNIPDHVYNGLLKLSSELHITPATIFYAVWAILLSSFTKNDKVCMGAISSGRNSSVELQNTVGMFIQKKPLFVEVKNEFSDICIQIREYLENDIFLSCQEEIINKYLRDNNIQLEYDSLVVVENYPLDEKKMLGQSLSISRYEYFERPSSPFTLQIRTGDKVKVSLSSSDKDCYCNLQDIAKTYIFLLAQIVHGCVDVDKLLLCSETDLHKNITYIQPYNTITEAIIDTCKKNSEKIAIIEDNRSITYSEIYALASRGASKLISLGIKKEFAVGVAVPRGIDQLISIYSIIMAGGVYVPFVNIPEGRANNMIEQAKVQLMITNSKEISYSCKILGLIDLIREEVNSIVTVEPSDSAYILFTSGSTGRPKGCEISHKAISNRLCWNARELKLNRNTRQLYKTPSTFDVSLVEIFSIFFAGHTLYILDEGDERIPEKIMQAIDKHQIDYLHFVPSMLKSFSEYIQVFQKQQMISTVKLLVCSGEILPADLVYNVYNLIPEAQIVNLYGPTEAAVDVSFYHCPKNIRTVQVPIGKPIDNISLLILDGKGRLLPCGVEGEIYILGDNLGKGYINQPELTSKFFVTLNDGRRSYRTGDRAYYLEDGSIVVLGRIDEQVKYNGVRIEPGEIEQVLKKSGLLFEISVVLKKQDSSRLIAFYRAKESCDYELRKYATTHLPEFMRPSDYLFVKEFPVSKHGKIDKKKLLEMYEINIAEEKTDRDTVFIDEISDVEKKLSEIWNTILNQNKVYDHNDNFFSCGGDSLSLIQMVVAIKKEWNVVIESPTLYDNPTLRLISQKIEDLLEPNSSGIHLDNWGDESKRDIAIYQLNNPDSTAYNMPILVKLSNNSFVSSVEQALRKVLNTYGWLYKTYDYNGDVLTEKFTKEEIYELKVSEDSVEDLKNKCREFVKPFSINDRLFRVELIKYRDENYVLLDFHHLLCDQNVIRFLLSTWIDVIENRAMPKVLYDYVDRNLGELNFKAKTENNDNMILDNISPLFFEKQGMLERCHFDIEEQINDSLDCICKEYGCSRFQLLFSAFFVLCSKISDKNKITIATNTTCDELLSQEMKLRILPVSIEINKDKSMRHLLAEVQQGLSNSMKAKNFESHGLFDVMFVREDNLFNDDRVKKYFEQVEFINKETKYGLSLFYREYDGKLSCSFDYDAGLFQRQAIEGFADSYQNILKFIINNREEVISNCSYFSEQNKQNLLDYCTGSTVDIADISLQEQFVKCCLKDLDAIAIYEGNRAITRNELYGMASRVANYLSENVNNESLIGIILPLGAKYLASVIGVLMAGCTFVPMDVNHPVKRHEQIIRESRASLYVYDELKTKPNTDVPSIKFDLLKEAGMFSAQNSNNAYCIFTSGSTGTPKGCVISQKNAINYLKWANDYYTQNEKKCFALFTSPAVDMTITSTLVPLLFGHEVVIFSQEADSIIEAILDKRVNVIKATPSHLDLLSKLDVKSNLECLIVGGEQLKVSTVENMKNLFADNICIYNEYGPTESTVACMIYQYSEQNEFPVVPIGSAIQNMTVTIRDKNDELCLLGTQGQLVIEGVGVINGYLNDFNKKQSGFYYSKEDKLCYATGDRARMLSDGVIIYEGRQDEQYKLNGYRVELAEISEAAREIDGVDQAYAVVEEKHLLLFCTLESNSSITEMKVRRSLFERIPRYMMPSQIIFIRDMPLASSGKIDRNAIIQIWKDKRSVSISNEIYNFIRQCWEEELGRNDFGDEDGFLEVGGNSISIISLRNRINKKFSQVSSADMFCYPSIATMTNYLEEDKKTKIQYNKPNEKEKAAIVGLAFELPSANDLESLREVFKTGRSGARFIDGQRKNDEISRLNNLNVSRDEYRFSMASTLNAIDCFDNEYFRIGKDEACAMDPSHKIILSVVDDALANAGITKEQMKGCNCAVIIAVPTDIGYNDYVLQYYPSLASLAPLNQVASSIAGRISYFYDVHGPAYMVDSACSSGLLGLNIANSILTDGECDMAIVAGVNLIEAVDYANVDHAKVLSSHYHTNTFSESADGTSKGEGCICYVLEREQIAYNNKHSVYAYIEGGASNNDGFATSLTAPNGLMQEQVIRQAWMNAGIEPKDVNLIETHGTATPLGDAIEMQALNNVMSQAPIGKCAISAAKSVYGHLDTVSGLLGVLKCILSIRYKEIYPLVGMTKPMDNQELITSPFYFPSEVTEWTCTNSEKVICGVSSFGLSGTNVHLVLSGFLQSDVPVKRTSRLIPIRLWLPNEPEVYCKEQKYENKIENEQTEKYNEEEITNILVQKVEQLFSISRIDVNVPLYKAGFDSISIIQLKLFIKNNFGIDIEVSSKDTISRIAREVSNYFKKKETHELNDISFDVEQKNTYEIKENYINSWYYYQLNYALQGFRDKYIARTKQSRERLLDERLEWANGRFMTGFTQGLEPFSYPILMKYGNGAEVWDIDGNRYIDFAMGFGANLFGYKHPYITSQVEKCVENGFVLGALMDEPFRFAKRICKVTGLERVSFCNSGTESIMNLIRIARAATGRNKIVVFEGSFHGTFDPVYVQKNEWDSNHKPLPRSIGTPLQYLEDVTMLKYDDEKSLRFLEENGANYAVVLVEPIQSRHPSLQPKEFLVRLREITKKTNTLLLFDEVISGFRNGLGGAQAFYGIEADLVSYGKVIGGGYPIGVFGGKAKYLDMIDHRGGLTDVGNVRNWVSTGGTFNGHPASIAAGEAVLDLLENEGPKIYARINKMTSFIVESLNEFFVSNGVDIRAEIYGSLFTFVGDNPIKLRLLQYLLISKGIFVWEGGTCFVSATHSWEDIHFFIKVVKESIIQLDDMLPENDKLLVNIDSSVNIKDYVKIKELIEKYPNIKEIRCLDEELVRVLTYNITNHNTSSDFAMIHSEINHSIDEMKVRNSIKRIINSHYHLRSGISWRRLSQPIQLIYEEVEPSIRVNYVTENTKKAIIENAIEMRKKEGFVLENAPLVEFDIFISENYTDVVISYYNSWFDGWSADLLLKEIGDAVLYERYPEQQLNWNEYLEWKEDKREEAEQYWMNKDLSGINNVVLPIEMGQYYEIRKKIPDELKDDIRTYCESNEISQAALYLSILADIMGEKYIMTSISGRGAAVQGLMQEIGLFSRLVPVRTGCPKEINHELELLNQLPACSFESLEKLTGVKANQLTTFSMKYTTVILNQNNGDMGQAHLLEDESYVYVPFRSYVLPEKEILITGNDEVVKQDKALNFAYEFLAKLEKIVKQ